MFGGETLKLEVQDSRDTIIHCSGFSLDGLGKVYADEIILPMRHRLRSKPKYALALILNQVL